MSKHLFIDWQKDGILVAKCTRRGTDARIEAADYQLLGKIPDSDPPREATLSGAVQAATQSLKAGKGDAIAIVSRDLVEMRTISVPKVDPDELPDIVRFQAQRQFANMTDDWIVDYVVLPDVAGQEMQTALVAALPPSLLRSMQNACNAAGLQLAHIALRPMEVARYVIQAAHLSRNESLLMVSVAEQNVDILVVRRGYVVLIRGTRLPADRSEQARALTGEVRRSLMAASPSLGSDQLTAALLLSDDTVYETLGQTLEQASGLPVKHINPLHAVATDKLTVSHEASVEATVQHCVNRFAAICGASDFEHAEKAAYVDFIKPKQRPPKKSHKTTYILAAAAAVMLLVAGISWYYSSKSSLQEELASFRNDIENKKDLVEAYEKRTAAFGKIEGFLKAALNWLDELTYISQRIPDAEKIKLDPPNFTVGVGGVGEINLIVQADSPETISKFTSLLADPEHEVRGLGSNQLDQPGEYYRWRSSELIRVANRGWDPFKKPLPPAETATETAPAETAATGAASTTEATGTESAGEPLSGPENALDPSPSDVGQSDAEGVTAEQSPATDAVAEIEADAAGESDESAEDAAAESPKESQAAATDAAGGKPAEPVAVE